MKAATDPEQELTLEAPATAWRPVVEDKARRLYRRARGPQADEEAWVHDVRVATRRFQEALALARPVLPPIAKARRRARALRRALGEARELDVLTAHLLGLDSLQDWSEPELLEKLAAHRDGLMARAQTEMLPKLGKHEKKAVALARRGPSIPFLVRDLAASHMYERCAAIEARLPCLQDATAARAHHRLRVDIKRLRYTLELTRPLVALDPAPLKTHQDRLGRLSDGWDLLAFARSRLVQRSLGERQAAVEAEIRGRIQRDFEEARDAALMDLPERLGDLRRLAGHVGKLV
jgi:CHAD domain-containing protein